MIRLSKMADYAIVVLTYMATDAIGTVATARDLANASGLPLPTVSKVVKMLGRAGLLHGHRGVRGGYSLARAASAISVIDIIAAVEGPVALTRCTQPARANRGNVCQLTPTCPARDAWGLINRTVVRALQDLTLLDMRHPNHVSAAAHA